MTRIADSWKISVCWTGSMAGVRVGQKSLGTVLLNRLLSDFFLSPVIGVMKAGNESLLMQTYILLAIPTAIYSILRRSFGQYHRYSNINPRLLVRHNFRVDHSISFFFFVRRIYQPSAQRDTWGHRREAIPAGRRQDTTHARHRTNTGVGGADHGMYSRSNMYLPTPLIVRKLVHRWR